MLPEIVEYGIVQGIIPKRPDKKDSNEFYLSSLIKAAETHADQSDKRLGDGKVHLPNNDISLMHSAVPFLPLPVAVFCATLNFVLPGSGTMMSGIFVLCVGQTRVNYREAQKLMTLVINILVGTSQFLTITFMLVGWFWSIAWGGLLIIYSMQYRDALRQRRQEAIATAALEALTRDSILHRRDVKTLVNEHKEKTEMKKETQYG